MPIKSEAEFIAWIESVETWIKNHIERHHNSATSHEDHLPVPAPKPSETLTLPPIGTVTVGALTVEPPAVVEHPAA